MLHGVLAWRARLGGGEREADEEMYEELVHDEEDEPDDENDEAESERRLLPRFDDDVAVAASRSFPLPVRTSSARSFARLSRMVSAVPLLFEKEQEEV